MRVLAKAFVGATTAVGIAVGGLAAGGTAVAAPVPLQQQVVSAHAVAPLAVNNLGLDTARAKNWQCWLRLVGFDPGAIDGQLGTSSWKAAQLHFNRLGYNAGAVDGIVGASTIRALQAYLNSYGSNLVVDGVAGSATRTAFWNFNATGC
ncbi:peptidoglycan-binding domain-containing protein [Streptomyces sp. NPDC002701]|uniref:peptidoglycan-binding domain-containing protein n=1 Tax=Streptomyces sp. NPDC002701 TaxID=3364661 RepID=UPI0036739EA2